MRCSSIERDQLMRLQVQQSHQLPIGDAGGQPQAQRGLEMPTAEVSLELLTHPRLWCGACQAIHLSPSVIKT